MDETSHTAELSDEADRDVSMFAVATVLLQRRSTIIALAVVGAVIGLVAGLASDKVYRSSAVFVPQAADASATSGLSSLASQFGFRVPSTGANYWGTALYVQILKSRMMLEQLALDTMAVPELGGRRIAVMDLLEIRARRPELRPTLTVRELDKMIDASDDNRLNIVRVSVESKWPSVSFALAVRLVHGINAFNLETRKSQAVAERQFVSKQVLEAERALRSAEDEMQRFLQRNRIVGESPELTFERDRLQRAVTLRQQVYTTLVQNLAEARIRAVRDVPVITVLEEPRIAVIREPRGTIKKSLFGFLGGLLLGILYAFVARGMSSARESSDPDASTFLKLLDDAIPSFRKRWTR